ncbi:MAG: murein biosynthesis integral membrane protein MurJ [Spirochaetia bacterium]|nr:murein biosynthesis integral membrane protein MurJ [Spirochaetia bacterium]
MKDMLEKPDSTHEKKRISSLLLMLSTLVSRLLGIVRVRLISAFFGADGTADVLNFTFSIPNNIRKLLAEGALSSAFIPVLTKAVKQDESSLETSHAQHLLARILGFQAVVLIPLTIFVWIFPESVITFLSDFSDAHQIAMASVLLKYFIIYLFIISVTAVIQAALNCRSIFHISALAPLIFSTTVIFSIIFLSSRFGAYAMGMGVLAGGFLQFFFQLAAYYKSGYRLSFSFQFADPNFRVVLRTFIPVLLTSGIFAVTQQVSFYLASRLPTGAVTALSNAVVFWQMPFGVFYVSIATVFFPAMSKDFQKNDVKGLQENLEKGIGYIVVFLLPSAIILFFLSREVVFSILLSGKFTEENAKRTADALMAFMPGLVFAGLFNYVQRFFYSIQTVYNAVKAAIIYAILDISITILCIVMNFDVVSLGIGNSTAYIAAFIIQMHLVRKELPGLLPGAAAFRNFLRVLAANSPLVILLIVYKYFAGVWYITGSLLRNFLLLIIIGAVCGLTVFTSYRLFSVDFLYRKKA